MDVSSVTYVVNAAAAKVKGVEDNPSGHVESYSRYEQDTLTVTKASIEIQNGLTNHKRLIDRSGNARTCSIHCCSALPLQLWRC
jgi:hypothetical protein